MDYKEFNVDLQLKDNHVNIVRGIHQFDGANRMNIRLMDGSEPFDFSNFTMIEGFIKKPDDTTISEAIGPRMQVIDSHKGKLSFLLSGQCTLVPGMHYLTIRIYDNTTVMSTARLNYYVTEANVADVTEEELQSMSEWNTITEVLASEVLRIAAENARVEAERGRVEAENDRAAETSGIIAQATEIMNMARVYADLAETWANAAQIIAQGGELPVVTREEMQQALSLIDGNSQKIRVRRGEMDDVDTLDPALVTGELFYATDTGALLIGAATTGNNIEGNSQPVTIINKQQWIASSTAPADTSLLWIDTAHDNCIKFYDDDTDTWLNTNGARFT